MERGEKRFAKWWVMAGLIILTGIAAGGMHSRAYAIASEAPQITEIPQTTEEPQMTPEPVVTQSPKPAEPTVTPHKKKEVKWRLVTKKGVISAVNAKGKKAKKQFVTVKKKTYYFDKKGNMYRGWLKKGNRYYYLSRRSGFLYRNGKMDGVKIRKGKAVLTKWSKEKLETMRTAARIVRRITNPADTREKKLYRCYRWVMKFGYRRYRLLKPICREKGWECTFANDIFQKKMGCCVSEASALAFLTRECGYRNVYVCHDTSHAWMELKGLVYDPLFSEAKNFEQYYGRSYNGYCCHPAGRRKI